MNSDSIKDLQALVTDFINKRDWMVYHSPKILAMSIAIEAAEIMELFQWITNVEADQQVKNDPGFVNELSYEIADVIIYCLSLCNRCNIDISEAIIKKIQKNENRLPIDIVKGRLGPYDIPERTEK